MANSFHDFEMKDITGKNVNLNSFEGKVTLVVNVASECGLTKQYTALEQVFEKYQDRGFTIAAFPANEFGAQEPGSDSQISEFCTTNFGVKFPMFSKIVVKGPNAHPLYKFLINEKPVATLKDGDSFEQRLEGFGLKREVKTDILWNFEKFLIGKDGKVIARFNPDITPDDPIVIQAIEQALN